MRNIGQKEMMQGNYDSLRAKILHYNEMINDKKGINVEDAKKIFNIVMDKLETGEISVIEKKGNEWIQNIWIKEAIFLGMYLGKNNEISIGDNYSFIDKNTFPLRKINAKQKIRIVPPSAGIRRGAYVGPNCVLMPPAYINVGAHVEEGTIIESLAGSCCYIGKNCHISINATIGGVLSPKEDFPVIIGDNVLLGEGAGVSQGVRIGNNVAIAPGVHVSKSVCVIDSIKKLGYCYDGTYKLKNVGNKHFKLFVKEEKIISKEGNSGPIVPDNALLINGVCLSDSGNLKMSPMIVKYNTNSNFFKDTDYLKTND